MTYLMSVTSRGGEMGQVKAGKLTEKFDMVCVVFVLLGGRVDGS